MGLVAVAPLCTKETVVNPSNTTSVQARGIDVVVVLLGPGKRISSGRIDGATWNRLPRSCIEGTVVALDGVLVPTLFAVQHCERRGKASCSPAWIVGIGTPVATGVAGFPGLAIVSVASLAGEARGGWGERGSTMVSYDVRGGSRGTVWTAALSFGTGTRTKQRNATAFDV
jgi:hypothetical protein